MKLSSHFAGAALKEYTCRISARQIMNYAAAIGDSNPFYFNDESPEGIIAPPLFPVAVTWPVVENIMSYLPEETIPLEVLFTQVHYSEHLIIHQPVRPDSVLAIQGTIAAVMPHRAGTYVIIRFDARDAGGNPLFTEYIGAMMRGVECADDGKGGESLLPVPAAPKEAAALWEATLPVDSLAPFIYDGCTNIHFPIHTSVKFAHQVGLPGIIHQGTSTLALSVHHILNREAGGDPHRVGAVYCRFSGMVIPGTPVRIRLTGKQKTGEGSGLFFAVFNAEGKQAISDGYIKLKA